MFIRTPYNYDADEVSRETGLQCDDVTLTKQEFKEDSDLNSMIRRFGIEMVEEPKWSEFDASAIPDNFMDLQQQLAEGAEAFNALPAEVRSKHDNNPQKFLDWFKEESKRLDKQEREQAKANKANLAEIKKAEETQKAPEGLPSE